MRIGLRLLKPTTTEWLRAALGTAEVSRQALARELCEREAWRNRRGTLCVASAAKALPVLARQLALPLPPPQRRRCAPRPPGAAPNPQFAGTLAELGAVRLEEVTTAAQRRLWRALLTAHHPQGPAQAPGCRLTYLVRSEQGGVLGGLSFVAAPMRLGPRDAAIGWSARARGAHLPEVVAHDRFLLAPGVRVPHLASHVLGQAVRRVAADWPARHGVAPALLETCVAASHAGTCYAAAGWQPAPGQTSGRPPSQPWGAARVVPKRVWLYPLRPDWRAVLETEPPRSWGACPALDLPPDAPAAAREFGRSDLPDGRLRRRLAAMGLAWENHLGTALPRLFPDRAAQAAAYRFLHNPHVTLADILHPHREALAERSRQERTVLAVQDTTALNFTSRAKATAGLGPLGARGTGLWAHAGVAFSAGGRPLGVLGLEVWARPPNQPRGDRAKESQRWFHSLEQAAELGRACPGTRVLSVGDRESDIFALFARQADLAAEVGLLVRANAGRQRRVQVPGPDQTWRGPLFARLDQVKPVVTGRTVRIRARGGRQGRVAQTEIRVERVELCPPGTSRGAAPIPVWAVDVRETQPPAAGAPLHWLLLASEADGAATAEAAQRLVRHYELRWGIEEFFRLLKTGAGIQDRQLRDAASLGKALAFDAIETYRVFSLQRLAREAPDTPAATVLEPDEEACLHTLLEAGRILPPRERGQPPARDSRTVMIHIARLVGFQPSKRQPLPGPELLWRGYHQLRFATLVWRATRATADRAPP